MKASIVLGPCSCSSTPVDPVESFVEGVQHNLAAARPAGARLELLNSAPQGGFMAGFPAISARTGLLALAWLVLPANAPRAAEVLHVPGGSAWRFRPGLAELVPGGHDAWRQPGFDDSGWDVGLAPLGYAEPGVGTDLGLTSPPMRGNYTSLLLRRELELTDASRVVELRVRVDFDDGFAFWINGIEVLRVNGPGDPGAPLELGAVAGGSHEGGTFEEYLLPPSAREALHDGFNVLAVQGFNQTLFNNDFRLDLELFDPLGPDLSPPRIQEITPAPGATVRNLTQVSVLFTEPVSGVDAGDLLAGGRPARSVAGELAGPYVFVLEELAPGIVGLEWARENGIVDVAESPNSLGQPAPWATTLDPVAEDDLVISELVSVGSTVEDEDGELQDWIEILNRGVIAVDLAGWALTDDPGNPGLWTFPARVLERGERLLVFASGKDRAPPGSGALHASFQLARTGEYLALSSPESPRRIVHELSPGYPPQRAPHSFGLAADGTTGYLEAPTPGLPNAATSALPGFAAEPVLDHERGFHQGPVEVALHSATPGATIFYTLDGTEPGASNGLTYAGPVLVIGAPGRAAVALRAVARAPGLLPSSVVTHTYVFPELTLEQPAAIQGFPDRWGALEPADYAMDASVLADPGNAERALRALATLPVLAISLPVPDLFDARRGIYANGGLSGIAWERGASAEILDPTGAQASFQVDCGLRIQGGSSTDNFKSKKLSLRLLFKGDHGDTHLEHRVFPDSPVQSFDTLVLDAHLNLAWTHPDHAQRVRAQYTRDAFVSDLQNAVGQVGPHSRFMNVFLDGVFWGVYDVHERPDHAFSASYFGGEKDEYDVIRHGDAAESEIAVNGTSKLWRQAVLAARAVGSSPSRYNKLLEEVDLTNLVDYMLVNFYVGNDDWPRHNWYASRRRAQGERWRFFSWDAEHVLKDLNANVLAATSGNGISPAEIFQPLRQNAEFRLLVADRVERHLAPGGALHVSGEAPAWDETHPERNRPAALYARRLAEIDDAIVLESARWGDVRRPGQPYTRGVEWVAERDALLGAYFPQRSARLLAQLRAGGLYPRTAPPTFAREGGTVDPGFVLELSLPPGQGGEIHWTRDGSDPRLSGSGEPHPFAVKYTQPITLSRPTLIRARTLDGGAWSALHEALFTVTGRDGAVEVTEIHYHPGPGESEFLELTSAGENPVDLSGARWTRGIHFTFPTPTLLEPGERLVLAADPALFREAHPSVPLAGNFVGSLDNGGERLTLVDRGEKVLVDLTYRDDGGWPLAADGLGHSLVLACPGASPGLSASWRRSAVPGGSPGAPDPEVLESEEVVISEVLARSDPPGEDFIELHNRGSRPVDIGGWFLSDRASSPAVLRRHELPAGTVLPPQGYLVVTEREYGSGGNPGGFGLDAGGEGVYLAAAGPGGELTGYVAGGRFPAADPGVSLGLFETSAGAELLPLEAPSPGLPNVAQRRPAVVFSEIAPFAVDPRDEFIELRNVSGAPLTLFDEPSGRGWLLDGLSGQAAGEPLELPPGVTLEPGAFLVLTRDDPTSFAARRAVPPAAALVGPWSGTMERRLALLRASGATAGGRTLFVPVEALEFAPHAPWPVSGQGTDGTLERLDLTGLTNEPLSWALSELSGGSPGAPSRRQPPGAAPPTARLNASVLSGEAPLMVQLDATASTTQGGGPLTFEWTLGDGATTSGERVTHVYRHAGRYAVWLQARDAGGNVGLASLVLAVEPGEPGGLQLPSDLDQDRRLGLSDAIGLLRHLFQGDGSRLPCGEAGSALNDPGNLTLLDATGDQRVDLSDALRLLGFLYLGGPPPSLGLDCVPLRGCPDLCE